MTASIRINDGTNPLVASTDNPNSFLATVHTLSNFDNTGVLGHLWTLVDKPRGSSAALSATTTPTTTLTPDVAGDYLVRLETYLDAARTVLDDVDEQVAGVRLPLPFDWRVPAAGETTQLNASRGWADPREEAIRDVHTFMNSGMPHLMGALNESLDGADPETVFGGFVLDGAEVPDNALKLRLYGTLTVAGGGDGLLRLYDMGAVGAAAAAGILRATATHPNASAGGPLVFETALAPVAAPGVNLGEIITARHRYELRGVLSGGAGGDTLKIYNGAVTLEA
jgi:hypothetical protein